MKAEDDNLETLDAGLPAAPRAAAPAAALPASFAEGRYKVLRLLGEGSQKQVFLSRDTRLDRDVVVSLLKTDRLDEKSIARLWREAHAMGRLGNHPHIVTVHDVGEENGRPFIVSEYVEGGSIADLIKSAKNRPLPLEQVLRLGGQLCQALAYAHARGIIHRDLKPANVWLTADGAAKLGDFGLALGLHLSRVTLEGMVVGTVAYMPPEQAMGRQAEPRSDLYSLGAMLYEMVTGRPPFLGDQLVGIISQHVSTPPVAPSWHNPELPPALEKVILQLLAKAPEDRPESAAAVGRQLAAIASSAAALAERAVQPDAKSLDRLAGGVFVGREQEMTRLRAGLNDAISGRGRLLLLLGELGSGKTRLTEQLAVYARLRSAQVLTGRCYEGEGAPAFWPWLQIIRAYVQEREPEALRSVLGAGAAAIAQVASEVRERLPDLPPPPMLEPEQARFRLFDSVTGFLKNAARKQPLVVILDDLHWADRASLLLLEFLARELEDARLLVVGTYRDVELGRRHPLTLTLGELARQRLSERMVLPGLSEQDVARCMEMTAGIKPPDSLVAAVYRETEGNPLFVTEIVRLLVAEGRLQEPEAQAAVHIPIPEGVREVIGRRLNHLSDECNRVLTIASVIGRDFSLDALEPLCDLPADRLLEVLDEAVNARVVAEVPRAVGVFTFAHTLVRETLYDEIGGNRRLRLHRRIGETLEKLYAPAVEPHLPELAYHFLEAAPGGDVEKAIGYAVRAAERASSLLAYEQAAAHYEGALEALELAEPVPEERRCELLLASGSAQAKAGSTEKARATCERAAAIARRLHAPELLARSALGIVAAALGVRYGQVDQSQVRLLEEALDALGDRDSALRARLLAHLALALYHAPAERRLQLSRQAVEMARRVGDVSAQLAALFSRTIALEGFEKAEERLAVATEIIRVADQAGNHEMALRGHYRRLRELLELGDIPAVDAEIRRYGQRAEELRQPLYLWLKPFCMSARALLEGRFDECERLAREALAIGQRAQDPTARLFFQTQCVTLRRLQGRAAEMEEDVRRFVESYPSITAWRASLAQVYCELDRREPARAEFEILAANDFAGLPRDGAWLVGIALLAQVCAYLRDAVRAAPLYELLLPFAKHNIVIGSAAAFYGPVARHLGLLASAMGHWEEAAGHFERALEMNQRMGARPFAAYAQLEYAAMLTARGEPGDREKALRLLEEARATAAALGMQKLLADVEALRAAV